MKLKLLSLACFIYSGSALAMTDSAYSNYSPMAQHNLKIVAEQRDHFKRNYMELTSNFGMVGPGILVTGLEYHSWAKDGEYLDSDAPFDVAVDSLFAPGFMYLIPLSKQFTFGPHAKYQIDDGYKSWLKAGFMSTFSHESGAYAVASYRFDRNLDNKTVSSTSYDFTDMDRKDVVLGYRNNNVDLNLRYTHFHLVNDDFASAIEDFHDGEFSEAELTVEYKGFQGFTPFASAIWESKGSKMNPTAFGNNGFAVGMKLHF